MNALAATVPSVVTPQPSAVRARAASVVGREHLRVGRNNQDGVCVLEGPQATVAVVCDGCSSEPRSEVGAQLGARFLCRWVAARVGTEPVGVELAEAAADALTAWLYRVTQALDGDPRALPELLQKHFLFTFLCAVHAGGRWLVFGVGDGAVVVDGTPVVLDAGPDNAPPYAAYRLLSGARQAPVVHFVGEASRVALATDGLEGLLRREPRALDPWFTDETVWRNPQQLQRRLNVAAERERFADDTTVVLLAKEA